MTTRIRPATHRPDASTSILLDSMPQAAALATLVAACGGDACPMYEVGPVANHLVGPTAALIPDAPQRPDAEPAPARFTGNNRRPPSGPDNLVRAVCGLDAVEPIKPRHLDLLPPSDLLYVLPGISDAAVSRLPRSNIESGAAVEAAINSGDPDTALPILDGRLAALATLTGRARATAGGRLDEATCDAVRTLLACLTGRTRWGIVQGWEAAATAQGWPHSWRAGAPAARAHSFLCRDEIAGAITRRLLN